MRRKAERFTYVYVLCRAKARHPSSDRQGIFVGFLDVAWND